MVTEESYGRVEADLRAGRDARFVIEEVTTGVHASGFGTTDDHRPFAFRVHRSTLYLELYRADLLTAVPDRSDVTAVAELAVTDIDLTDERSVVAAVRDAVGSAEELQAVKDSSAVRSFFDRVDSIVRSI